MERFFCGVDLCIFVTVKPFKMNRIITIISLCLFGNTLSAQTPTMKKNWYYPMPSGIVTNMIEDTANNQLIINGSFDALYSPQRYGVVASLVDGSISNDMDCPNAEVFASVSDGNGGWYIGGDFTLVGDSSRYRLAHIDQNGFVTGWNLNLSVGTVHSLAIEGSTLYIGGLFTSINGELRNNLAAIDLSTNTVLSWNPNVNDDVYQIYVKESEVYISGNFTNVGGLSRDWIASLDVATGGVNSWNPITDFNARIVAVSDTSVYLAGSFTQVNGINRNRLAAVDRITGTLENWDPNPSYDVNGFELVNDIAYVGGNFNSIGGQPRTNLACVDLITGLALPWNPLPNGVVSVIKLTGNRLFIGGMFTVIDGQSSTGISELNIINQTITSYHPNLNDPQGGITGTTFSAFNDKIYIGGSFSTINYVLRSGGVAALDLTTGKPTGFNPNITGSVNSMALSGSTLYISGGFSSVNSVARNYFATIDVVTNSVGSWEPTSDFNAELMTIDETNGVIYVGGSFTHFNGQPRSNLAALDLTTGLCTSWNPNSDGAISSLILDGQNIIVGGNFTNVGGENRNNLAILDATTALATTWNPGADGIVRAIEKDGDVVYVGGDFTNVSGVSRLHLAAINLTTGQATDFDVPVDGPVATLKSSGVKLFVGGTFSMIGNNACYLVGEVNKVIGVSKFNWNPVPEENTYAVYSITGNDSAIYIAGHFNSAGFNPEFPHRGLMAFEIEQSVDLPISVNTYSSPSDANSCNGNCLLTFNGDPYFYYKIDASAPYITPASNFHTDLCPGIYSLLASDEDGDILSATIVSPVDSNYIFNNPFIDSIAVDSLGATIEDCDIYYNSIDTAFIDSIFANGNTVTVIWNIVDSNGSNFDTSNYVLNNGNGVYYLQLSVFCPTKSIGDYFAVTEAIYFEDGDISTAGLAYLDDDLFELFPNPTNDVVTLRFEAPSAELVVFDAQGKRIQTHKIISGDSISLSHLETGVYFFELTTEKGKTVKRVVKQ